MNLNTIILMLSDIISVPESDLKSRTPLTAEYGIEPIDIAKLVIQIEKRFNITIHDEDVHTFKRIGDIAGYVDNLIADR